MERQEGKSVSQAASMGGMSESTARKYLQSGQYPNELEQVHTWRTRPDPFSEDWLKITELLSVNPALQAKTVFDYLCREHPSRYQEGQLRTLQRRMRQWLSTEGPPKEVYFTQVYRPGERCQSDFTHLSNLGVTIAGMSFDHLLYHFTLPYSGWETGTICFSESFESSLHGLQNAHRELAGVRSTA